MVGRERKPQFLGVSIQVPAMISVGTVRAKQAILLGLLIEPQEKRRVGKGERPIIAQ
jgi:hypothetical protein